MTKPNDEKDKLNCPDEDCDGIESCDCQGICTCESEIDFDDIPDDCDACCCDEDDDCDEDDEDCDEV